MLVAGPVAIPQALEPMRSQIKTAKVCSFLAMPRLLVDCRMVLGPLLENPFTECKSGLKFFEAAVLGVPVAATPIPDIDRFESPLLFKCETHDDWAEALRAKVGPKRAAGEALRIAADTAVRREAPKYEILFRKVLPNAA